MTNKKRGLGRGLEALIPSEQPEKNNDKEEKLMEIEIDMIVPNPDQPRKNIDNEKLQELVESIKEHGIVQPVVVRPVEKDKYELIAGERRWRACRELNYQSIPALVRKYDDLEASAIALIENIQRENLNALEEAQAYDRLMSEFSLTQDEISKRLGKSRPFIANMVRLLNLPGEIKDMVRDGSLTAGHARALISIKDKDLQLAAALKIVKRDLNVRQTEEMIKKMLKENEEDSSSNKKEKEEVIKQNEESLSSALRARVQIDKNKKGNGKIVINFDDEDHLKYLVQILNNKNVSRETFS